MRKRVTVWGLLCLIALLPQAASAVPTLCDHCQVEVEALYWKPFDASFLLGRFEIIQAAPKFVEAKTQLVSAQPNYDWGIRARARCCVPCLPCFVGGGYLYHCNNGHLDIEITDPSKIFIGLLFSLASVGDTLATHLRFEHHSADLLAGLCLVRRPRYSASLYAGGRYTSLNNQLTGTGSQQGQPVATFRRARFSGSGPLVGVEGRYCFYGLELSANLSGSALVGRRRGILRESRMQSVDTPVIFIVTDSLTTLSPCLEVELSAAYGVKLGCFCMQLKVGYDARRYIRALNPDFIVKNSCPNGVTVGGPFAGINASF